MSGVSSTRTAFTVGRPRNVPRLSGVIADRLGMLSANAWPRNTPKAKIAAHITSTKSSQLTPAVLCEKKPPLKQQRQAQKFLIKAQKASTETARQRWLNQAIKTDPTFANAQLLWGEHQALAGRLKEAQKAYTCAARWDKKGKVGLQAQRTLARLPRANANPK